ncbi:Putative TrmH family tRNA/rRNA methyltransferase [Rickettsiales bacterium Ac37b]|nr:Putative TrmH family tRNA/rRNA methyltransferase [Rickettsiales bacterium Ac37b]
MKKITHNTIWLYGKHAVFAALKNPNRKCYTLLITKHIYPEIFNSAIPNNKKIKIITTDVNTIASKLPNAAVHQNMALEVATLPEISLEYLINNFKDNRNSIIILDQITDTHNIGAILRSAAAFNCLCVILPRNHAPNETNTMAKSASGALESVPLVRVTNLAHTINYLKSVGYWCIGLDASSTTYLEHNKLPDKTVFIMGNEETGLRRLTKENCDFLMKIPMSDKIESLNVSNAAAITLYTFFLSTK